jgi:hypothetical protein
MHDQTSIDMNGGMATKRRTSFGAAASDWLFTSNGTDHAFDALGRAPAGMWSGHGANPPAPLVRGAR